MPLIFTIICMIASIASGLLTVSLISTQNKNLSTITGRLGMMMLLVVIWLFGAFFFASKNVTVRTPVNVNHNGVAVYSTINNNKEYTFNIKGHNEYNRVTLRKVVYNASDKSYIQSTTKKTTVFPGIVITSKNFSPVAYLRTK